MASPHTLPIFEEDFLKIASQITPQLPFLDELVAMKGEGTLYPYFHAQIDVVRERLRDDELYLSDAVPFMKKLGVAQWYTNIDPGTNGKHDFKLAICNLFRSTVMMTLLGSELSVMEDMGAKITSGPGPFDPNDVAKFLQAPDELSKLSGLFQTDRMADILKYLPFQKLRSRLSRKEF